MQSIFLISLNCMQMVVFFIKIYLEFVSKGPINDMSGLVQLIIALRAPLLNLDGLIEIKSWAICAIM